MAAPMVTRNGILNVAPGQSVAQAAQAAQPAPAPGASSYDQSIANAGSQPVTSPTDYDARAQTLRDTMSRNQPGTPAYVAAQTALAQLGPRPAAPVAAPTMPGAAPAGASTGFQSTPATPAPAAATPAPYGGFNAPLSARPGQSPQDTLRGQTMPAASAPAAPAPAPATSGLDTPPPMATVDYSRFDQGLADIDKSRQVFMGELDRLSGVDPFGNQAFMQKATDRAVAQASGTAAMARGGAAAQAGAQRQAQGIQASMASQGIQNVTAQRAQDEQTAEGQRLSAAGGIANLATSRAGMEADLAKTQAQTMESNLGSYIANGQLKQTDVDSLRQYAVELGKLDMTKYQTDTNYQIEADKNLTQQLGISNDTWAKIKGIAAQNDMTPGKFLMGAAGMGAGLGMAAITAGGSKVAAAAAPRALDSTNPYSDRRTKFDVSDPDLRDLQDYLGNTKGKLYRYKEPDKPGRRAGLNFGPMAQDLAATKIGATVVEKDADGLYRVDTQRLALADHAALAALADEVRKLKARK